MDIKEKIKLLIEKDIAILGYSIWGIEVSGNTISKLIRLFIDKNKGKIDLLDCEKVSNQVVDLFDNSDLFDFKYRLEVSSPGIERSFFKFDQHEDFIGDLIEIKFKKENTNKTIRGELTKFEAESLEVKLENNNFEKIDLSSYMSSKLINKELI
tara:strand:+ start:4510 stop:4971 length:462 start_codon:yes stop_codon:yes gene_type:complete